MPIVGHRFCSVFEGGRCPATDVTVIGEISMQLEFLIGGIVCVLLLIYLTYTILHPEND